MRVILILHIEQHLVIYVDWCSQGLADNCVVAKVNGDVWDLDRPLESDCELCLLKFDDPDGLSYCLL